MRDTYHSFAAVQALASASQGSATTGPAIDLSTFESVLFVVNTGAVAGSGDFSFKLQESSVPDDAGFADVAAADLLGAAPTTLAATSVYRLGYVTSKMKRYVRLALIKNGGTSIQAGAVALLGHGPLTVQ